MFSQNVNVFVKIFTFVITPLKVSKYCDFFLKLEMILIQILLNASMNGFRQKLFDLWKKWCN